MFIFISLNKKHISPIVESLKWFMRKSKVIKNPLPFKTLSYPSPSDTPRSLSRSTPLVRRRHTSAGSCCSSMTGWKSCISMWGLFIPQMNSMVGSKSTSFTCQTNGCPPMILSREWTAPALISLWVFPSSLLKTMHGFLSNETLCTPNVSMGPCSSVFLTSPSTLDCWYSSGTCCPA